MNDKECLDYLANYKLVKSNNTLWFYVKCEVIRIHDVTA
jgi:hypothetical protein